MPTVPLTSASWTLATFALVASTAQRVWVALYLANSCKFSESSDGYGLAQRILGTRQFASSLNTLRVQDLPVPCSDTSRLNRILCYTSQVEVALGLLSL